MPSTLKMAKKRLKKSAHNSALHLVVISGLSGSGQTTALRCMEDMGFYCIDNLPGVMVPEFLEYLENRDPSQKIINKVALVMDARGQDLMRDFGEQIKSLKKRYSTRLLFFDARDKVLFSRYSESRRRHPSSETGSVEEGIRVERRILANVESIADKVIDTSDVTVHELKQLLSSYFHFMAPKREISITLVSFGFKYGIPIQSDLILDVRFLPNPFFEKELKHRTGTDPKVSNFVMSSSAAKTFVKKTESLLSFLIREYKKEGKSYLTISFGCTGGRHRSVAIVNLIGKSLTEQGVPVSVMHRDEKLSISR